MGVLGTGTTQKRGVLGTGTSRKRGVLRTGLVKRVILINQAAQNPLLWAYLLITLTFSCQHDQLVGVYSDRQKRGVLGTGQIKQGNSVARDLARTNSETNTTIVCICIGYRFPLSRSTIWGNHLPVNFMLNFPTCTRVYLRFGKTTCPI